jgi:hypothetical protein
MNERLGGLYVHLLGLTPGSDGCHAVPLNLLNRQGEKPSGETSFITCNFTLCH